MGDIEADIVVIGAGATGAAAAWRLATGGLSVVCIERGDWFDYAALHETGAHGSGRNEALANPNRRRGAADYPVDDIDSPIKPMIGNGVGGSTIYWAAHEPRFRPEDFRTFSLDGVGADWPLTYGDLTKWYELNEAQMGLAFVPGDPSAPPRRAAPLPLPGTGAAARRMAAAFDRLGWHWWPVDLVVGRDTGASDVERCTHPGPCDIGCPARRRASVDSSYWPAAIAAGARLLTGARVLSLEHDRSGRVTAAITATEAGRVRVRGERFVLAANGMGTPRLLLASTSGAFPDGLANRSGQVGRNLMLHPYAWVDGRFDSPLGTWVPGEKAGLISLEFYPVRAGGIRRGVKLQLSAGQGPSDAALGGPDGPLPWGRGHHQAFTRGFDRVMGLSICAEDLPEPDNRIVLSDRLADSDGVPAPRMVYSVSDNTKRLLEFGMDRAEEALREAGAVSTTRTPLKTEAGFHLMGTARMGTDPETSVVDAYGRCHEAANLVIADASVFVTASALNPTASAQALALRAADRILSERR